MYLIVHQPSILLVSPKDFMKKYFYTLAVSSFLMLTSLSALATTVDTAHSEFKWRATKVTGAHNGKIFLKSAELKSNDTQIVGAEFVMDIGSFTVEDLQGESATKLATHLKSPDFFDVAKFPTAKLVIESIEGNKAKGVLTIKDKSLPVTVEFHQMMNVYFGKFVFDRTKFDMIYGSGSFFKELGDKAIHDEVELTFKVVTQ